MHFVFIMSTLIKKFILLSFGDREAGQTIQQNPNTAGNSSLLDDNLKHSVARTISCNVGRHM